MQVDAGDGRWLEGMVEEGVKGVGDGHYTRSETRLCSDDGTESKRWDL